ncbi:MAG: hypothetical protein QOG94_650 [Solirubrobacteraceae bacterium]|jgi:hypothetical protein|nr:hypothetical protein [Solirubrobacteraceae bacterium]
MQAVRADSVLDQQSVMRNVVQGIADAALVIAEISQVNANVYYELGLAHALLKPTILLTQDISKVPFDLKAYRVVTYSTLFHEVEQLSSRLTEIAIEHLAGRIRFGNPITDYLDVSAVATVLPSTDTARTVAASEIEDLADEYLDWLVDLQDADERLGELLTEIATATEEIGEKMAERAAQLDDSPADELSPKQARALARGAAADLAGYADVLERVNPELTRETDRFVTAGLNLADWFRDPARDNSEGRPEFLASISTLHQIVTEGRAGLDEYRTVVGSLRGITSDLSRASTRAGRNLDEMFETIDNIVAFCERSIAIVPAAPAANDP